MNTEFFRRANAKIIRIGVLPTDDDETRVKKGVLVATTVLIIFAAAIWGLLYIAAEEYLAAAIPLSYSVLSSVMLTLHYRTHRWELFRFVEVVLILILPILLMLTLGGYNKGSVVIVWAFIAPLIALLSWGVRPAAYIFGAFLVSLIVSGLLTPVLRPENNLTDEFILTFYVINIGAVALVVFVALIYFVRQKELALELMRRNRELERANMAQELLLRQSEKLATLGRLSAGVAHELNNPAAAVQRGTVQLADYIDQLEQAQFRLGYTNLTAEQATAIETFDQQVQQRAQPNETLDPIERSDLEYEIENHLDEQGVDNAWEVAPALVDMHYKVEDVIRLSSQFTKVQFPTIVASLSSRYSTNNLIQEIGHSAGRISEIVQALKTYTYLDQAPIQFLEVHEGLENTLVMLRSKLKQGVTVHREFAADLPCVQGYGSELNQVWTNIIDNAIEAMNGSGDIWLRTRHEGEWVYVEIADNGPGIPEDVKPHIFDPFYTTKELGKGTGLGLNISQNIVVQQHGGAITVDSQPGKTCFTIKLPLELPTQEEAA